MKAIQVSLIFILFPIFLYSQSPNLSSLISQLSEEIEEVQAKKYTYSQTLTSEESAADRIRFEAIRTDSKGKTKSLISEFSLKYMDAVSVRRANVKDVIVVKTSMDKKKKFIRTYDGDGEQGKYLAEWEIICNNANHADRLVELLKKIIPLAKELPPSEPMPTSFDSRMEWLTRKVADAKKDGKSIQQKLVKESDIAPTRIILETEVEGKKKSTKSNYHVNLTDLDKKVELKVKGKNLYLPLRSKNKYIRYLKDGSLQNFQKDFNIYVQDVETGLQMEKILETMIKESADMNKTVAMKNGSITSLVKNASDGKKEYEQIFKLDESNQCLATLETVEPNKKENKTKKHIVHLDDLVGKSVEIKISKKTIWLNSKTEKSKKYIQVVEDEAVSKYMNKFSMRAHSIENAKLLKVQLEKEISDCEGKSKCVLPTDNFDELMKLIQAEVKDFELGSKSYQQSFAPSDDEPDQWKYVRVEPKGKGTIEKMWVFDLNYLDANRIDFDIAKKQLVIFLPTTSNEETIKYYEDSEPDDYAKKIAIYVPNITTARQLVCAFQTVVKQKKQ